MQIVVYNYTTDGDDVEREELPDNYDWEEEDDTFTVEVDTLEEFHQLLTEIEHPVAVEVNSGAITLTLDPAAE